MRSTQRGRLGQGLCRPDVDPTRERWRCRDHSLRHRDEGEEHGTMGRGKVHDCQGSSGTRRSHQGKTGDLFLSKLSSATLTFSKLSLPKLTLIYPILT